MHSKFGVPTPLAIMVSTKGAQILVVFRDIMWARGDSSLVVREMRNEGLGSALYLIERKRWSFVLVFQQLVSQSQA